MVETGPERQLDPNILQDATIVEDLIDQVRMSDSNRVLEEGGDFVTFTERAGAIFQQGEFFKVTESHRSVKGSRKIKYKTTY